MDRIVRMAGRLVVGISFFIGGCDQQEKPTVPSPGPKPAPLTGSGEQTVASPGPSEPPAGISDSSAPTMPLPPSPPPATIPKVVMDETRRSTFRVWVGDLLPDGQLLNLQGQSVSLQSLRGEKVTVLVFWNSSSLSGLEELQDLAKEVLPKYQEKGVRVVAVNVGEEPSVAHKALPAGATSLPILADSDGRYLAQIAQRATKPEIELLPRTYVVDGQGKVLWLDMGYTESTLRGVETTIRSVLGQ